MLLSTILPIAAIVTASLFLHNPALSSPTSTNARERRLERLRGLNASLLGLGVSLATATIVVTGVKNLSGTPRPDFLARCDPDVSNVAAHKVGGYGQAVSELWVMVDGGTCQQADKKWLNDGFRSFPSGYATSENCLAAGPGKPLILIRSCVCGFVVSFAIPKRQIRCGVSTYSKLSIARHVAAKRRGSRTIHSEPCPTCRPPVVHEDCGCFAGLFASVAVYPTRSCHLRCGDPVLRLQEPWLRRTGWICCGYDHRLVRLQTVPSTALSLDYMRRSWGPRNHRTRWSMQALAIHDFAP